MLRKRSIAVWPDLIVIYDDLNLTISQNIDICIIIVLKTPRDA